MGPLSLLLVLAAPPSEAAAACHLGSPSPCRPLGAQAAARLAWVPADVARRPLDLMGQMRAIARVDPLGAGRPSRPPSLKVVELEAMQTTDDERCLGWYEPVELRHPPVGWRWLALDVAGVPSLQPGRCNTLPRLDLLGG